MNNIFYVHDRITGNILEYLPTMEDATEFIKEREDEDREDEKYEPNSYGIKYIEQELPVKLGLSNSTNTIYIGKTMPLLGGGECWYTKEDVTDQAVTIAFEHLYNKARETGHFEMSLKGYGKLSFDVDEFTSSIEEGDTMRAVRVLDKSNLDTIEYKKIEFKDLKKGDIFKVFDNEEEFTDAAGYNTWEAISEPYENVEGVLTVDIDCVKDISNH